MSRLSIIVAFHQTDAHLGTCLRSLARQTVGQAEVLLVPVCDGGPDAGEGAAESAEGEEQPEDLVAGRAQALEQARAWHEAEVEGMTFTLLEEPAATPALARAAGVDRARGELLALVDGRDALTDYALEYLSGALGSGGDLALGGVHRFNELGTRCSAGYRAIVARERRDTRIDRHPTLVRDRLLGNRVMRRELWESAAAAWDLREGAADLSVPAAHFGADSVHVLPGPVYLRRDQKEAPDLSREPVAAARLAALSAFGSGLGGRERRLWDAEVLRSDLWKILMRLDDADGAARRRILQDGADYLEGADPAALRGCSSLRRLGYHLLRRHDLDRLLELVTFAKSVEPAKTPIVRRGLSYYLRYPYFEDPEVRVPREVYRADTGLALRQKTETVEWRGGELVLAGRAAVSRMPARRRWQQYLRAHLVAVDTGERRRLTVTARRAAEYHLPDVPEAARHDYGGFEIRIPEAALRSRKGGSVRWKVELTVFTRGITRRHTLANPVAGAPRRPPYRRLGTDPAGRELWARPDWDAEGELQVSVQPVLAKLTSFGYSHSGGGDTLELSGELEPGAEGERYLRLVRRPGTAELRYPLRVSSGRFRAEVPVAHLLERAVTEGGGLLCQERWDVALHGPEERSGGVPVVLPDQIEPHRRSVRGDAEREIAVERTTTGHVRLRAGWARPAIEEARWDGRRLVFVGRHPGLGDLQLVIKAQGRTEEHSVACERDGERFRAVFAPAEIPTPAGEVSLAAGTYTLWGRLHRVIGAEHATDTRAELSPELLARLPLQLTTEERSYALTALDAGRPVLRVGSDLRPEEKGTYAQRTLREKTYPQQRRKSVREEILFDSYTGRQCSDSPYDLYAELRARGGSWAAYPMNWLVDDGQIVPPPDTGRVRRRGREFYESLARSRYLVTNSRQPQWFEKRPDQVVVQTWHGSMLKRIGFDIENIKGKTRDYHEKLAWETRQWDYLVSPSPWATPILRRAFRFEGEILETGYPRNDIFYSAERERIATDTRKRLGLRDDRKVILYAPTWRDDQYYTRGKHKLDLHLDLRRMYEALGEEYVLLVRPHPRVVDRVPTVGRGFVHDVSRYPEVMELFLITDVLITDYSSMMFDFANTGRPMLFFTYDLESYRDQLRGFYFDFEETAPGPLLKESEQVVEAVADLDSVRRDYAAQYDRFVRQFCPLDDGRAAARIVDRVFGAS